MGTAEQGRIRDAVQVLAAVVLIGLTAYVVKLAVDDRDSPDILWALAAAACVGGLIALGMWLLERHKARDVQGQLVGIEERWQAKLDEQREATERKAQELEGKVRDQQQALNRERDLRVRVERARSSEHEWNRELRSQVVRMHRERGALSAMD